MAVRINIYLLGKTMDIQILMKVEKLNEHQLDIKS